MRLRAYLTSAMMPPVGACRFGCGTSCAAPVTVFWLFGVVSIVYGFLGGPMGEQGVSWYTVLLGLSMWLISAVWTMLTIQDVETEPVAERPANQGQRTEGTRGEDARFKDVKKAL